MSLLRTRSALSLAAALFAAFSHSAQAQGTIGITIADVTVQEPGGGFGQIDFLVTVARDTTVASGQVSAQFRGASGTAHVGTGGGCQPGDDLVVQQGIVTILASSTQAHILATTCSDGLDEDDAETFTMQLFSPLGATIADGSATGTLLDADAPPTIRVSDVTVAEGNPGGGGTATFTLTLSGASGRTVSVLTSTPNGTASGAGGCGGTADFVSRTSIPETFVAGATSRTVNITICGDAVFEGNETFSLALSSPTNVTISDGVGAGTITNDDPQPVFSIAGGGAFAEGNAGAIPVQLTVSLNTAAHGGVSVTLGAGGTATTGGVCAPTVDATVGGGAPQVLQWAAGDGAPKHLTVNICGDTRDDEDVDQLDVALSAPSSGIVAPTASVVHVSITDDDASPGVTVADVTGLEPSTAFATSTVTVPLTLSAVSNRDVDVTIGTFSSGNRAVSATAGSSCSRGVDYLSTSHNVHFAAGSTVPTKQPGVTICYDGVREGSTGPLAGIELLEVRASNAVNSVLVKPVGSVAIKDQ